MGLDDRPYVHQGGGGGGGFSGGAGGFAVGLPKPSKAVKWILIATGVVFLLQVLVAVMSRGQVNLSYAFGATVSGFWQIWRYVTFQFLHDTGGIWHIALNMLGVYMLGTPLEQRWGTRRFLWFYLTCGAAAGVVYVIMAAALNLGPNVPLIGASGGVFGILLAAAVLFPHFRIIFLFFPVPIRLAALVIFGGMILKVLTGVGSQWQQSPDFWSQVAHMGGAIMGAIWVWGIPQAGRAVSDAGEKVRRGAWDKRMEQRRHEQQRVDDILDKIRQKGIGSLSRSEKRFLKDATKRQQQQDRDIYR